MKPRTRIRVTDAAPPQYSGRKGWAMEQRGEYWLVAFEGGQASELMHRSWIAEESPAVADTTLDPHATLVEWAKRNPDMVVLMVGFCPVAVPRSIVEKLCGIEPVVAAAPPPAEMEQWDRAMADAGWPAIHAQQASDFARILRMERSRCDSDGGEAD